MAGQVDGSIVIDLEIQDKESSKQIDALSSKLDKQTEAVKRQELAVRKLKRQYDEALAGGTKATGLAQKLKEAETEAENLSKQFDRLFVKEQEALSAQSIAKTGFLRGTVSGDEYGKSVQTFDALTSKVDETGQKLREAEANAKALREQLAQTQLDATLSPRTAELASSLELAESKLARYRSEAQGTATDIKTAYDGMGQNTQKLNSSLGKTVETLNAAKQEIESMEGQTEQTTSAIQTMFSNMATRIGNMLKRKLYYLAIFKTISVIVDEFKELSKTNAEVNESLSAIYSSVTYLKNSLVNALIPVLKVITPILVTIIDAVAGIFNMVGRLIALITGSEFQEVTKENLDYAESLEEASDAAEKALASFDDLNKIDFPDADTEAGEKLADYGTALNSLEGISLPKLDLPILPWLDGIFDGLQRIGKAGAEAWEAVKQWASELNTVTLPEWLTSPAYVPAPVFEPVTLPEWMTQPFEVPEWSTDPVLSPSFGPLEMPDWTTSPFKVPNWSLNPIPTPTFQPLKLPDWMAQPFTVPSWSADPILSPAFEALNLPEWATAPLTSPSWAIDPILAPAINSLAFEAGLAGLTALLTAMSTVTVPAWANSLKENFSTVGNVIKSYTEQMKTDITKNVSTALDYVTTNVPIAMESMAQSFYTGLNNILKNVSTWGTNTMESVRTTMQYQHDIIARSLTSSSEMFSNWIKTTSENLAAWGNTTMSNMVTTVKSWYTSITEGLSAAWDSFKSFMINIGERITGWVGEHKKELALGAVAVAGTIALVSVALSGGLTLPAVAGLASAGLAAVPALATGAVIQPNNEFFALLGDQKSGVNIEAPLSTITEAFRSVISELDLNNNSGGDIVMNIDGREFARITYPYTQSESNRRGVRLMTGGV